MKWIAVDWGTTRLRGWLMDGASVADSAASDKGMAGLAREAFEPALLSLVEPWLDSAHDVIACGMVGARQGWQEAAYIDVPSALGEISGKAIRVRGVARDLRILPGMAQRDATSPDVMRGEETQLLGLQMDNALVCIPGTHSKWVHLRAGRVDRFATHMTGELYALLSTHSILRHAVQRDKQEALRDEGFLAGLEHMMQPDVALSSALFTVRARGLVAEDPGDGGGYLSGLLIGAEIRAVADTYGTSQPVTLLADGDLGVLYATALRQSGFVVRPAVLAKASRAGLLRAAIEIWG